MAFSRFAISIFFSFDVDGFASAEEIPFVSALSSDADMVFDIVSLTSGLSIGGFFPSVTLADSVINGLSPSQDDGAKRADIAGATYAVDGAEIRIGGLSNGFNALGGMVSDIATGHLPADTTILKDFAGAAAIEEGRAIAQVVHDIASGSSIAFCTATNISEVFGTTASVRPPPRSCR
jgi:hypothetical protein